MEGRAEVTTIHPLLCTAIIPALHSFQCWVFCQQLLPSPPQHFQISMSVWKVVTTVPSCVPTWPVASPAGVALASLSPQTAAPAMVGPPPTPYTL